MEPEVYVPPAPARLRTDVFLTFGGKVTTLVSRVRDRRGRRARARTAGPGLVRGRLQPDAPAVQVGGLGLTTANPYFAARSPGRVRRSSPTPLWLAAVLGIVLALAGASIKVVAPGALEGLGWARCWSRSPAFPGGLAALLLQSVLLGEGRMVAYNAVEAGQTALTLLGVVAASSSSASGLTGTLAVIIGQPLRSRRRLLSPAPPRSQMAGPVRLGACAEDVRVRLPRLRRDRPLLPVVRFDLLLVNAFLGRTRRASTRSRRRSPTGCS